LKIGIVIPARLESERLPNKVLRDFYGMPMIEHVWRRAQITNPKIQTIIATDNDQIISVCEKFGAITFKTSTNHTNALSRVGEASKILKWDYYIVLQADEILVEPENLDRLYAEIRNNAEMPFFNLISNLDNFNEIDDVNIVKCLLRPNGTIINIMRKSSSVASQEIQKQSTNKICGIYAVSNDALQELIQNGQTIFEKNESIEQMRAIEMGMNILGVKIRQNYPSVNTIEEALQVENILVKDKLQKELLKSINTK
jgi:3-deoxy-manno-octulosonate cytidylyltransferase (CMP-KDO synthetase)